MTITATLSSATPATLRETEYSASTRRRGEALSRGTGFGMWVHVDQDLAPLSQHSAFAVLVRPIE